MLERTGQWPFPIFCRCNCDAVIGEDMVVIRAYLAQEPVIFPDAWWYKGVMADLWDKWRAA